MRISLAEFHVPLDGLLEVELADVERARAMSEPVNKASDPAAAKERTPVLSAASGSRDALR